MFLFAFKMLQCIFISAIYFKSTPAENRITRVFGKYTYITVTELQSFLMVIHVQKNAAASIAAAYYHVNSILKITYQFLRTPFWNAIFTEQEYNDLLNIWKVYHWKYRGTVLIHFYMVYFLVEVYWALNEQ